MTEKRADTDRILVAQLNGEARHHAKWHALSADEEAAAVAALHELAAGRADLLAEVAGVSEGFSDGEYNEPLGRQIAQLCRDAGADEAAIPAWIEVGRERRASSGRPPFSAAGGRRPRRPTSGVIVPGSGVGALRSSLPSGAWPSPGLAGSALCRLLRARTPASGPGRAGHQATARRALMLTGLSPGRAG